MKSFCHVAMHILSAVSSQSWQGLRAAEAQRREEPSSEDAGRTRDRQKHSAGSETPTFVPPLQRPQHAAHPWPGWNTPSVFLNSIFSYWSARECICEKLGGSGELRCWEMGPDLRLMSVCGNLPACQASLPSPTSCVFLLLSEPQAAGTQLGNADFRLGRGLCSEAHLSAGLLLTQLTELLLEAAFRCSG